MAESKNATIYIAYPLRFHPVIKAMKPGKIFSSYCWTNGRKWPTYRKTKDEGGGVLLELSHEIDYAGYLLGGVESIHGYVDFEEGLDGTAGLCVMGKDGNRAYLHLNLFSDFEKRMVNGQDIHITDALFIDQLAYFFTNMDNPQIMNNIHDASKLFRKIIEFREEAYGKNASNHLHAQGQRTLPSQAPSGH